MAKEGEKRGAEFLDSSQSQRFEALYNGLRHPADKPTWRTTVIDISLMLGVKRPDLEEAPVEQFDRARQLITVLTEGTHFAPLLPEFLCGLGFDPRLVVKEIQPQPLDFLIVSGRFGQDPLYTTLPDYLAAQGYAVATLNPIGTHGDDQRRFIGLPLLTRPVDHLIFLGQTQSQRGGSFKTVRHALRTLDCKPVARQVSHTDIVIPFYGGSRGHRLGQRKSLGFEVLEAPVSADELSHTIHEVQRSLRSGKGRLKQIPQIRVYSIDIHNLQKPGHTFKRHRVEFESLSPAPEFASAIYQEIQDRGLSHLPIKVVVPDKGAIPRSESMVEHLLRHPQNHLKYIDIVYVDKFRTETGEVDPERTKVAKVMRWSLGPDGSISKTRLPTPTRDNPDNEVCIVIGTDDMTDGCTTGGIDMTISSQHYPQAAFTIFTATHPVLSKGPQRLNLIPVNLILLGNSLPTVDTTHANDVNPEVRLVDLAPTLARGLVFSH